MELIDRRQVALREWFAIKVDADLSKARNSIHLVFRPNAIQGWMRTPVIAHSQVGYHPAQQKRAILELDPRTENFEEANLIKITAQGEQVVFSNVPEKWGNFYRYLYAIFEFTEVRDEGVYQIQYGEEKTLPFRIADELYQQGVWQPSLLVFLPVQMCHVSVKDRERLWHGLCHKDDGLQAPAPLPFYDGYRQTEETETQYDPNTTIPGMNVGGWHDAGDDDVNTGSSGKTTYHIALAYEEFQPDIDQTTVDYENNSVHLHRSDGVPDMLQQVKHGVDFLLAQYRAADHSFVGVISKDWEIYLQEGMWGHMTDNLFYDPKLPPDTCVAGHSGTFDDRYIFTNKDTRREYAVITYLAASERVLKNEYPKTAAECLQTAKRIWSYEESHKPVFYPSVGTPRNLTEERTNAAVELYLCTEDRSYLEAMVQNKNDVFKNIDKTAWTIARVINDIDDASFKREFEQRLVSYRDELHKDLAANPFGVFYEPEVWGFGWDILWGIYTHYYLVKHYPDIFPLQPLEDAVHYSLGAHAASDISLVSGVGAHDPIPAFGMNRSDYSYIPGGLYSGVNLNRPDFPELKSDHPYLWQQSEYIVFGATPFIFAVLAVDHILNN
ncbi:glycoside hydrolase [candidate division KSB1 bacterium]|nr:glycoside hydrolase [candidate division KSB1 bacterium]